MIWEEKCLDELGTISRGKSKHRPRNDPELYGGVYPFIQTADVKNVKIFLIFINIPFQLFLYFIITPSCCQ